MEEGRDKWLEQEEAETAGEMNKQMVPQAGIIVGGQDQLLEFPV